MAKFIFVTGGVVSGLGKGITAASLGRLLKCRGLKVASQKLDPYVNVDPGTMSSPYFFAQPAQDPDQPFFLMGGGAEWKQFSKRFQIG